MHKNVDAFGCGMMIGIGIAALVLMFFGIIPSNDIDNKWKNEAVAHGAAHYSVNSNGVVTFKWNK